MSSVGKGELSGEIRVWVDGERVDEKPALAALDHGISVGDGVFETCKVVNGRPFALDRHHERLDRSLAGIGLPPADRERIGQGIEAVLEGNPIEFGRLRYVVTAGPGPLGSDRFGTSAQDFTYIVSTAPQPLPPASGKVVVVPWTRNERSAVAGLKTTSYAENVVALAYAQERGGIEAIFANTRGELCECTGSNVFVVQHGQVLTPPLEAGPLAGITRGLVIEWCREEGLTVREQTLPVEVLQEADEVFITSSTKDVMPVHAVDDRDLPTPGPVTQRAAEVFARLSQERPNP
ncbi:MAG TPA: aminodeoxychorismate lyase [Segeticoccus sp.]|uniref:aminotransferase class IV n=1 Tax=Segeticoccus sp. TaxID=2706531 RepID=UPI002D7E2F13|nr:aminodeoxychorismate lyase [Segeticoccus sp.]HET8600752.1 aminodeoxychorismate lyase [Segeticoccus sp.]